MAAVPQIVFEALVGFCLISALITTGLGAFVYAQKSDSRTHRLFLVLAFAATYWALGEFFIWQADSYGDALFWLKASSFWTVVIALTVHFIFSFTGTLTSKEAPLAAIIFGVLYLPAVVFALIEIFTDWIFVVAYEPGVGYIYLPAVAHPVYLIEAAYFILIMLCAAYVSFVSWWRAPRGKIRRQNRLVCIGVATVIVLGFLSVVVLPVNGIHLPNLVFIGIVVFALLIVHAIRRYGLFTLSPETAVPDILRTMPDGLILVDPDGSIVAVNASTSEIFGIGEEDLIGRPVASLISREADIAVRQVLREQGRVSDLEADIGGEEPRAASIAASLVRDQDGDLIGAVLIVRDITGRKASETALRIANEKLSLLSQLTRHDIGNLVTALAAYLSLLQENGNGRANERYLSLSIDLVEMIMGHLKFSREYQEIGSSKPVWQALAPMIDRAAAALPHAGIEIRSSVAQVKIYADPLLFKVMYNLLENSIRHGKALTRIFITTDKMADGTLVLAFEDDGVGVGTAEKEKVFAFGYGKNTGFGLAFSREILSVTGIDIAETGTCGRGARFEIQIPCQAWEYSE